MTNASKTAVLWTGGKDCALAMHEAAGLGRRADVLVTFAPAGANFIAHPLPVMQVQAEAMGLPHRVIRIDEPYREGYIAAIRGLRDEGIATLVTGDIDRVAGLPNWIRECCTGLDVEVLTSLWGRGREELMLSLVEQGFEVMLSLVKRPWLDESWAGRTLDRPCIEQLKAIGQRTGLDICGENGEFHTLVLNGPTFRRRVRLEVAGRAERDGMTHLEIRSASLEHP